VAKLLIFDDRMKEVEVGGVKVLLLKSQGTYHALGSKCSHYGAPLVNGEYVFCFSGQFFFSWSSFSLFCHPTFSSRVRGRYS